MSSGGQVEISLLFLESSNDLCDFVDGLQLLLKINTVYAENKLT